jgi:hypothetical protein
LIYGGKAVTRDVSLFGDIDGSLAAMTAGIGRAQETTAAADSAAGRIAARAAGSGFAGIAQAMARVRDTINEVHAQITGLGTSIDEARAPLTSAPDQMSPQQTINVLAAAAEKMGTIHTRIGATIATVDQVRQLTTAILEGGQPGPMLARLDAIKQVLIAVARHGNTAKQQVDAALAEARKTADAGKPPRAAAATPADRPPRLGYLISWSGSRLRCRTPQSANRPSASSPIRPAARCATTGSSAAATGRVGRLPDSPRPDCGRTIRRANGSQRNGMSRDTPRP